LDNVECIIVSINNQILWMVSTIMQFNHRQVEAFRYVYQTGNMTAAGELMGISQPAISRLIRDLETALGFSLFERARGGLTPTSDANELFREVQRSFLGLDRLHRIAKDLRNRRPGNLRIAATVAISFYLLPLVIQRYRKIWPEVRLSLHSCASPEVLEGVATQQYDIGVSTAPPDPPGVRAMNLPIHYAVCVIPEKHPLAAKEVVSARDLDNEPLLLISDYSVMRQKMMRALEAADINLDIVLEATYSAPVCELVKRDVGIAILEPVTARAYAEAGIVIRPFDLSIPVELKLIHSSARPLSDRANAFSNLIKDEFRKF
jgi:DNA-binding transcriptional LysR family regulator